MSRLQISFARVVAIALLTWMALGAVAAPLTACCAGAEPCCVLLQFGQGCNGCSTAPAMAVSEGHVPNSAKPEAPEGVGAAHIEAKIPPPWKPPD